MPVEPAHEVIASAIENTLGTTPGVGDAARRAVADLENAGYFVIPQTFNGLVRVAEGMLDLYYPADLFGRDGPFADGTGSRFTQHLRDALAVLVPASSQEATR